MFSENKVGDAARPTKPVYQLYFVPLLIYIVLIVSAALVPWLATSALFRVKERQVSDYVLAAAPAVVICGSYLLLLLFPSITWSGNVEQARLRLAPLALAQIAHLVSFVHNMHYIRAAEPFYGSSWSYKAVALWSLIAGAFAMLCLLNRQRWPLLQKILMPYRAIASEAVASRPIPMQPGYPAFPEKQLSPA